MNNNKIKLIALASFLTLCAGLASCQSVPLTGNEIKKSYEMDENPVKVSFFDITKNDAKVKIEANSSSIKILSLGLYNMDNHIKLRDISMDQTSITDLMPNTDYKIGCKYLELVHGDYYEAREYYSDTFKTLAGEGKVEIKVNEISFNSARFEVNAFSDFTCASVNEVKGELFLNDQKIKDVEQFSTITELLPDTEYKLVAHVKYGYSEQEQYNADVSTTFKTLAESDFAVKPLVTSVNSREARFELSVPKHVKDLHYQTSTKLLKDGKKFEDAYINSGIISNLSPNTTYELQIETTYFSFENKVFISSTTFQTNDAKLPPYIDSLIEFESYSSEKTSINANVKGVKLSKREYVLINGGRILKDGKEVSYNENYLNFNDLEPETIYDLEVQYTYINDDVRVFGTKTFKVATAKNTENHATVVCNDFGASYESCRFDFSLDSYAGLKGQLNSIKLVSSNGHDLNIDSKTYKGSVIDLNKNDYYTFYIDYDYEDVNGIMHNHEIYEHSFSTMTGMYYRGSASLNLSLPQANSITAELYVYKEFPNHRCEITKKPLKFYIDGVEQEVFEDPNHKDLYVGLKPETTYEVVGQYSYTDPIAKVLVEKEIRKTFTTRNTDLKPYLTFSNVTKTSLDIDINLPKINNARTYISSSIIRYWYGKDITRLYTDQYSCHLENIQYNRDVEVYIQGYTVYDSGYVDQFTLAKIFNTKDLLDTTI